MLHYYQRKSLFIILVALALGVAIPSSKAQMMAPAGAIADIPTFQIVNGWNVQKTPLSQAMKFEDMRLPCVMTAGFDNGFTVRFSGGGGKIMAMAIDFRQEIFRQGRKYSALITADIAQHNVSATAFSENILLFKIKDTNGFYQSVMRDAPLIIDVEGNTFRFMMSGIMEGMTQLEQCYDPKGGPAVAFPIAGPMPAMPAPTEPGAPIAAAPQPVPLGGPVPITPDGMMPEPPMPSAPTVAAPVSPSAEPAMPQPVLAQVEPVNNYPEWGSRVSKAAPHDKRDERRTIAEPSGKLPTKKMDMAIQEQIWTAKDGDSIEATIRRWSDRAGVDIAWQAGPPVPVMSDFEYRGTFNEAVQALIAENAATSGLVVQMAPPTMAPAPISSSAALPRVSSRVSTTMPQPITPAPVMNAPIASAPLPPMASNVPAPSAPEFVPFKWSAPSGASLQGVLEFWSKQAGVDFVWQSNQNFELKRGINNTQSYEAALQSVLEQFSADGIYPTAQLNKDPITGKQTLFVFSARNG